MTDLWRMQAFVGVGLIAFFFPLRFYRRIGIAGVALWSYVLVSCAFGFLNPGGRYVGSLGVRIDQSSGVAFAIALLGPLFVITLKPPSIRKLWTAFEIFVVIDSAIVLVKGFGAFNNASMDTAFIATMVPSLFFRPERFEVVSGRVKAKGWRIAWMIASLVLPVSAVLLGLGATAIFTLAVGFAVYGFLTRRYWAPVASAAIVLVGAITQSDQLIDSTGRTALWKKAFDWWLEHANFAFGTGFGTFEWVGLMFQGTKGVFLFMHNEFLQILFEGGAVGFAFAAAFGVSVVMGARNRPWLMSTIAAILVMFSAQFPLRFFFGALFILLVCRVSIEPKSLEEPWPKS